VIWILFAAALITGLIVLSGVEYGKRLAAEHRVATLEAQLAVSANRTYLVGEEGAELFPPRMLGGEPS